MQDGSATTINGSKDAVSIELQNKEAIGEFLLICEHAANYIPAEFGGLGLDEETLSSHIAWDPGALDVARNLSKSLQSPLVAQTVSRLIFDCNRPLEAEDAAPFVTERGDVPGNKDLSFTEIRRRFEAYYVPFWMAINDQLNRGVHKAMVTVHSFTPVYEGKKRSVEIGILHDEKSLFADILIDELKANGLYKICRNEPYGPLDGVTHTLKEHAVSRGLPNVMIEIRNDLLDTETDRKKLAEWLGLKLALSLAKLSDVQGKRKDPRNN